MAVYDLQPVVTFLSDVISVSDHETLLRLQAEAEPAATQHQRHLEKRENICRYVTRLQDSTQQGREEQREVEDAVCAIRQEHVNLLSQLIFPVTEISHKR